MNNDGYKNKVALITGASRGIGRATALKLAEAGAVVIINYQGNYEAASETLESIQKINGKAEIIKADVSSTKEVEEMVDTIIEKYGRVDILVNNAGITKDTLLIRMKDDDWNKVITTNLTGVFNCTRAVLKYMLKQKMGRIVNVSSVVGISGNVGQANYAAAKAGIIGFTKSAAKEAAARGININAVAPGFIITDMTDKLKEETKNAIAANIPQGRMGTPEDVANVIMFLAGPLADYVNGQVIAVDGGMNM